ncbi:hypothetical protein N825_37450 [Skermanella stibiiresistens SB22]|uniref:Uncharacterized protein n=1 Tax=Skermanella stibiiresistens SB22 TaxID=1385369 RepID=W9GPC2_9PROT|nr:hypothetical protein N825_37450 [Skermanella stibiiresistens SB22]
MSVVVTAVVVLVGFVDDAVMGESTLLEPAGEVLQNGEPLVACQFVRQFDYEAALDAPSPLDPLTLVALDTFPEVVAFLKIRAGVADLKRPARDASFGSVLLARFSRCGVVLTDAGRSAVDVVRALCRRLDAPLLPLRVVVALKVSLVCLRRSGAPGIGIARSLHCPRNERVFEVEGGPSRVHLRARRRDAFLAGFSCAVLARSALLEAPARWLAEGIQVGLVLPSSFLTE